MVADRHQCSPDAAAKQVPAQEEHYQHDRQREIIEPLVRIERQAERRIRLDDHDALHPAGPLFEVLVLEQLGHRHAERKRRQREIQAFKAQGGQAEKESHDQAHESGHRDSGPVGHAIFVHEDRRYVGADGVKRAVAERNLAVVPGQDVEAEQCDRVHKHQRALEGRVVADEEWQGARGQNQDRDPDRALPAPKCSRGIHALIPWLRGPCRRGRRAGSPARR